MSTRKQKLSLSEIKQAFADETGQPVPAILSTQALADLIGVSRKTLYEWLQKGRLDGAFRKRGKHNLFWRDRALDILFNGPEWSDS